MAGASAGRHRAAHGVVLAALVAASLSGGAVPRPAAAVAPPRATLQELPHGQVLRRTLAADAAQEYFLYVPRDGGRGAPICVAVHGISRNAQEHATLLAVQAEAYDAVLVAPYFAASRDDDYQRLGRTGRGRRADAVLDAIVAEVVAATGAQAGPFHLFGFSGGAQFAHRYTMAHPERVASVALGAPGWYTFPDPRTAYPYGIGPSPELPGVRFEPERFLKVPIAVFVGSDDTTSESLRRNAAVDAQQGTTRVERARRWVAAMCAAAEVRHIEPRVTFETVPGIRHSFRQFVEQGGLGDRVFQALFGAPAVSAGR